MHEHGPQLAAKLALQWVRSSSFLGLSGLSRSRRVPRFAEIRKEFDEPTIIYPDGCTLKDEYGIEHQVLLNSIV